MVKKLFWDEPYRTTLKTHVRGVDAEQVTLDETIFYAMSGGQESDHGRIGGAVVESAQKEGMDIVYTLPVGHGLQAGQEVSVEVDWTRRYRLMRLHFAAEVVLELMYRLRPGIDKVGAHIAADKARIDFTMDENISTLFPALTEAANTLIAADKPIISAFSDEAEQRRYWEVADFAHVPCGGTHLRRTGEVGPIQLKRKNIGRGKERVEILLTT